MECRTITYFVVAVDFIIIFLFKELFSDWLGCFNAISISHDCDRSDFLFFIH